MISGKVTILEGDITQQRVDAIVKRFLQNSSLVEEVLFMCFNRPTYDYYKLVVKECLLSQDEG